MADNEYIDRGALLEEVHRIGGHNLCGWETIGVKALVERQPAADVVEVVRCKDCENYAPVSPNCGNCFRTTMIQRPKDFCSRGKRKEATP